MTIKSVIEQIIKKQRTDKRERMDGMLYRMTRRGNKAMLPLSYLDGLRDELLTRNWKFSIYQALMRISRGIS